MHTPRYRLTCTHTPRCYTVTCIHTHPGTCSHAHTQVHTHIHTHTPRYTLTCTHTQGHTHMHTHTPRCTDIYIDIDRGLPGWQRGGGAGLEREAGYEED